MALVVFGVGLDARLFPFEGDVCISPAENYDICGVMDIPTMKIGVCLQ